MISSREQFMFSRSSFLTATSSFVFLTIALQTYIRQNTLQQNIFIIHWKLNNYKATKLIPPEKLRSQLTVALTPRPHSSKSSYSSALVGYSCLPCQTIHNYQLLSCHVEPMLGTIKSKIGERFKSFVLFVLISLLSFGPSLSLSLSLSVFLSLFSSQFTHPDSNTFK